MSAVAGRTVVVTGAGSGIGRGIAGAMREAGARVVVADISAEAAGEVAADLDGLAVAVDVADEESVRSMVDQAVAWGGQVDVLVANAGVGPQAPVAEMGTADWRWLLDVNLWGVIHGVAAVLPGMLARGSGHIVVVSSMSALAPTSPLGGYAVTKAGVSALSEVLGQELTDSGVGVTQVVPGPTRTGIGQSLRHRGEAGGLRELHIDPPVDLWRTPEEVGRLVVEGVAEDRAWVVTHPELWSRVQARHEQLQSAFGQLPPV